MQHTQGGSPMREKVNPVRCHHLLQVGIRSRAPSTGCFLIRQRHQRRLVPGDPHPPFDPVLDCPWEVRAAGERQNEQVCVSGRASRQLESFGFTQDRKTPHQMAKLEIPRELSSQLFVKIPGAHPEIQIFIKKNRRKRGKTFSTSAHAWKGDDLYIHNCELICSSRYRQSARSYFASKPST